MNIEIDCFCSSSSFPLGMLRYVYILYALESRCIFLLILSRLCLYSAVKFWECMYGTNNIWGQCGSYGNNPKVPYLVKIQNSKTSVYWLLKLPHTVLEILENFSRSSNGNCLCFAYLSHVQNRNQFCNYDPHLISVCKWYIIGSIPSLFCIVLPCTEMNRVEYCNDNIINTNNYVNKSHELQNFTIVYIKMNNELLAFGRRWTAVEQRQLCLQKMLGRMENNTL